VTVGRPPNVLRPCKLSIYLPEDLKAKLDLHLFSQLENRIPHGAYSTFMTERVRAFFNPTPVEEELAALKRRMIEAELGDGWSLEQKEAMESFRDHILRR